MLALATSHELFCALHKSSNQCTQLTSIGSVVLIAVLVLGALASIVGWWLFRRGGWSDRPRTRLGRAVRGVVLAIARRLAG